MSDLIWGLQMMVVGMGVVFALLLVLMLVLMAIGRLDVAKARKAAEPPPHKTPIPPRTWEPVLEIKSDGLDAETIAAIAVAVSIHAENRRRLAAPETRSAQPGSQLFASRWLAVGRGQQNEPFRRR